MCACVCVRVRVCKEERQEVKCDRLWCWGMEDSSWEGRNDQEVRKGEGEEERAADDDCGYDARKRERGEEGQQELG